MIQKQPGSNVVQVVDDIKALLPSVRAQLPPSVPLDIRMDRSDMIRESVHDVKLTLILALVLVIAVIFVFLRSFTATIIPSLTLPVSLIATFAVMYLLNYSLDNLSLMALTLCIGFVVDDTIVMLENIGRHMEMGKPAMRAAFDGAKEVEFTIIAMTCHWSPCIPCCSGGIVGRLLQGSPSPSVAILVVLRVDQPPPMLCSRFLKTAHGKAHG
jgi:HAE1 family hydrophobic/amphiphilic exporter-1